MTDIVERLRIKADMVLMCEKIKFGSDAAVMKEAAERIEQLEAALRAAYEVYAGSEGFIAETCAEGYQQQIITQMVDCISAALEERT